MITRFILDPIIIIKAIETNTHERLINIERISLIHGFRNNRGLAIRRMLVIRHEISKVMSYSLHKRFIANLTSE
jgi:hypothetical protein